MAKSWYPVVDYAVCEECGTCVGFCTHGVYEKEKAPSPVVVDPDACVEHCHGCGDKCPVGAIAYVGDDTGWTPSSATGPRAANPCCGGEEGAKTADSNACGCERSSIKNVLVEYLYLDLHTCDRCIGTDTVLDEVMDVLSPALAIAGYSVEYKKTEMVTVEIAEQHRFLSSPTICVNGQDICESVAESDCGCCGAISGTATDCRVFEYESEIYEVPPKAMLAEAILKAVFGERHSYANEDYELPENLRRFFDGKASKAPGCSCGGDCR